MSTQLVIGASGFLGSHVTRQLVADGHDVRVMVRGTANTISIDDLDVTRFVGDIFDPDLVVIAGGVSSSAPLFLDEAREEYAAAVTGHGHRPLARIRTTQLGEAAGMIGAAELARSALIAGV